MKVKTFLFLILPLHRNVQTKTRKMMEKKENNIPAKAELVPDKLKKK